MTFGIGRKYHDAVGRRWKILTIDTLENGDTVMIARRLRKVCIAVVMREKGDRAIVLTPKGFTTIYADEPPYKGARE